jgi:hypothetical protein
MHSGKSCLVVITQSCHYDWRLKSDTAFTDNEAQPADLHATYRL